MFTLFLILACSFVFRFFRELEDEIARGNMKNWTFFPNSDEGWTTKWKYPFQDYSKRWYHFGIHPKHAERFAFSSTIFVFLTDAEHFYQFIQTVSLLTIVYLASDILKLAAVITGFAAAQILKETIKTIS